MANWTILKEVIANVIKTNGNQEITGQVLQNTLTNIVNAVGENATFVGVATPSTNPGTPDGPAFYIAPKGTYPNFGPIQVKENIAVLKWNGTSWVKSTISSSIDTTLAIVGTIKPCEFTGGTQIDYDPDLEGVWGIGTSLSDDSRFKSGVSVVKYTASAEREILAVNILSQWVLPYRWLAIFDADGDILYELACNCVKSSYAIVLQKGQTILASCEVFANPTILTIATEVEKVTTEVEKVAANDAANSLIFPINTGGYIWYQDGSIFPSTWSGYSDFIDISNIAEIKGGKLSSIGASVAFYDENKTYLNDISVPGNDSTTTTTTTTITDEIRAQAKYARVSFYANSEAQNKERRILYASKYVNNPHDISEKVDELTEKVDGQILNDGTIPLNGVGYYSLPYTGDTNGQYSRHSEKIPIANIKGIYTDASISNVTFLVGFFSKDGTFLPDLAIIGIGNGVKMGNIEFTEEQKAAHSFVVQFYGASEADIKAKETTYVNSWEDDKAPIAYRLSEVEKKIPDEANTPEDAFLPRNYCGLGIVDYQLPIADINHIAIYGQSLSTGTQGCPVISIENFRGNLMVGQYEWLGGTGSNNKSGLNLLKARPVAGEDYIPTGTSDQTNGETAALTFTNAAKALFDDYVARIVDRKFLDTSSGAGGNTIETLSKNYPPSEGRLYKNFTNALSTVKSLVDGESKTIVCTALVWMQGEWNETQHENQGWTGTDPATADTDDYQKMLQGGQTSDGVQHNGLINDMIEDVMAAYGQENTPIVLATTIGRGYHRFFENPIDMALLRTSNTSKGKFVLVTPDYRVTDRGGHLDANGYRWCGEFLAKVWYKRVILRQNWHPLQPIKITKYNSTSLLIKFNVPEPPLEFDIWQVKQGTNYGFLVHNDGVNVAIESVEIYSPTEVMIKTSLDLTGVIEVAYATAGNTYGNLRDSDKWIAFGEYTDLDTLVENPEGVSYRPSFEPTDEEGNVIYGKKYPMQNFCVPFYYKLDGVDQLSIDIL